MGEDACDCGVGAMKKEDLIIVRGGGDIATGTIYRLWKSGYRVLVTEIDKPSAIRRQVAVSEAVYSGIAKIEDMVACLADSVEEIATIHERNEIPVIIDGKGSLIDRLKPKAVVDAILAKRNINTSIDMAELVIALGPGFEVGKDAHYVIETMRGHNLGRIISEGCALPNTGIPGPIGGYTHERVIHADAQGIMHNIRKIGDIVEKGDVIAIIAGENNVEVRATISGIIRGLIRDEYPVTKGFKIADIDPRVEELRNCFTISDKARCISGSVLELVCANTVT